MNIPIETARGLLKPCNDPRMTIENVELRATLDKAVEDAELNVTERLALNKKFFPNGGGFELFPKGIENPKFYYYHKRGKSDVLDSFTKEVQSIKIPEDISRATVRVMGSSKNCFQANLDNAIKKLKKVLKGNI